MSSRHLLLTLVGVAAAFAGGFLLANGLNRSEIESLHAEIARLQSSVDRGPDAEKSELSNAEIQEKIKQADARPEDFQYQKNLGIALSKYASMKQDELLLVEAARIIDRAAKLKGDDRDLLVAQGNAHFDIGLAKKDNSEFETARTAYEKALNIKPNDPDVRTDLGLTYFLSDPPDMAKAEGDFKRSLAIDPRHEKSLVFLVQALAKQQKQDEARQYLAKLRSANPQNDAISGLTAMVDSNATAAQ